MKLKELRNVFFANSIIIALLAYLSRRLISEPIIYHWSGVRPSANLYYHVKPKALLIFLTVQLICVFAFAYAKTDYPLIFLYSFGISQAVQTRTVAES